MLVRGKETPTVHELENPDQLNRGTDKKSAPEYEDPNQESQFINHRNSRNTSKTNNEETTWTAPKCTNEEAWIKDGQTTHKRSRDAELMGDNIIGIYLSRDVMRVKSNDGR